MEINKTQNEKSSWQIKTQLPIEYEIKSSYSLFSPENLDLLDYVSKRALVVIDSKVHDLYWDIIDKYFDHHKIEIHTLCLVGEEIEKNLENLLTTLTEIEKFGVDRRNEPIIAIGGGVIMDVVGLAATLYRRGIPYVRIPTTLLGIVDVSVAAKTGINFENRRNRLGSYYPPVVCFLDKSFLKTLDYAEISSGMGEILKMSVIKNKKLFFYLEKFGKKLYESKFEIEEADAVIEMAVSDMIDELKDNLWEKNLKRCVDYGHSFSPIIEMRSLVDDSVFSLLHGQAVTLDVIFSSILSYNRGILAKDDVERIISVAKNCGLLVYHQSFTNPQLLLESLQDTTKHRNGDQNLPVPTPDIGSYKFLNDVTYDEIRKAVETYKKMTYE